MTWQPEPRGTVLIPSGTYHNPDKKHLFIVCAQNPESEELLLTTMATWVNDLCDSTCILEPGDHPFIVVKSYILYRKCRIETISSLVKGVEGGHLIPMDPFENEPFQRICDGIPVSPQTNWKFKRNYKKWLGS